MVVGIFVLNILKAGCKRQRTTSCIILNVVKDWRRHARASCINAVALSLIVVFFGDTIIELVFYNHVVKHEARDDDNAVHFLAPALRRVKQDMESLL